MWWVLVAWANAGVPEGAWEVAEDPEVVEARIEAVVDGVASQFGIFKGLAKSRLIKGTRWCKGYVFAPTAEHLSWSCDGREPLVTPRSALGTPRELDFGNGPIQATIGLEGDVVTAFFGGENGGRRQVFRQTGPTTMVIDIAIESDRLDRPMTWSIAYARVEAPASVPTDAPPTAEAPADATATPPSDDPAGS